MDMTNILWSTAITTCVSKVRRSKVIGGEFTDKYMPDSHAEQIVLVSTFQLYCVSYKKPNCVAHTQN